MAHPNSPSKGSTEDAFHPTPVELENGHRNEEEKQDALPPKEGTPKAYLALLAGFLGIFISFGWVNCVALFQAQYEADQLKNYSSSEISWITSIEFFLLLFFSPVSGYLFDNYGPRLPVLIGGFLLVFGLMMTSLSSKYYQIMLSQSVVAGLGASLMFNPCVTAPMTYFRRARALAGGLTVAGSSVGGVVFPIMVNRLLPRIGFAWTMRACAFLALGLWLITLATISSKVPHARKEFHLGQYFHAFKEPNFILVCVFFFFLYWAIIVPLNYVSVAAETRGMSMTMAFNLVPILNAASFIGRVVPNILADRYGRLNLLIIMCVFTNIILLAVWLPGKSNAAIIVFAALYGIGSGACIGLAPVLVMTLSPSHHDVGLRMGAALAVGGIAGLTSPPIAGAISARSGGTYDNAFIFAAANGFVATGVLVFLRGRVTGWGLFCKEG